MVVLHCLGMLNLVFLFWRPGLRVAVNILASTNVVLQKLLLRKIHLIGWPESGTVDLGFWSLIKSGLNLEVDPVFTLGSYRVVFNKCTLLTLEVCLPHAHCLLVFWHGVL